MKKRILAVVPAMLLSLLAACGGTAVEPPSEADIIADLDSRITDVTIGGYDVSMTITRLEIEERRAGADAASESVRCSVTMESRDYSYETGVVCDYSYTQNDGWVLLDYTADKVPVILPLRGVPGVHVDRTAGELTTQYGSARLIDRQTDLDALTDELLFEVSGSDAYAVFSGHVSCTFEFSVSSHEWSRGDFIADVETALHSGLTEQDILSARDFLSQYYDEVSLSAQSIDPANLRTGLKFNVAIYGEGAAAYGDAEMTYKYVGDSCWELERAELPELEITTDPQIEPPQIEPPHSEPVFDGVSASGYTPATSRGSYEPQKARDGRPDTAWNVPNGPGIWIMLSSATEQYVSGIRILSGFTLYSEERGIWVYDGNHRPKDITVSFSDGASYRCSLDDVFDGDNYIYQDIPFDTPHLTTYVKITVESIYRGDRWDDICISEIEVY